MLSYYADTSTPGRPLLLLHSTLPGASAADVRPLFERFRLERPVYALDLPGFGFSERGDRPYTAALYVQALLAFVTGVLREPADVIALGGAAEFAAGAALERPQAFQSLTLISPTGLGSHRVTSTQRDSRWLELLRFPLWSQAVFDLLTHPVALFIALQRRFNRDIPDGLLAYARATTHQPGARFAPLAALSGALRTPDALDSLYARVQVPVLVIYDRDPAARFDALPELLRARGNWRGEQITPTYGMPHFERLRDVTTAINAFWGSSLYLTTARAGARRIG